VYGATLFNANRRVQVTGDHQLEELEGLERIKQRDGSLYSAIATLRGGREVQLA